MTTLDRCATALLAMALIGCGQHEHPGKFKQGDMVEFVLNGQRAQIIFVSYCERPIKCSYDVRLESPQVFTDTRILSSDGPLHAKPLARLDYVREYELRPAR